MVMDISLLLLLGVTLFAIGLIGMMIRRNILFWALCTIIMNASLFFILLTQNVFDHDASGIMNLLLIFTLFIVQFIVMALFILIAIRKNRLNIDTLGEQKK